MGAASARPHFMPRSTLNLLAELRSMGVKLSLNGDSLSVSAQGGTDCGTEAGSREFKAGNHKDTEERSSRTRRDLLGAAGALPNTGDREGPTCPAFVCAGGTLFS